MVQTTTQVKTRDSAVPSLEDNAQADNANREARHHGKTKLSNRFGLRAPQTKKHFQFLEPLSAQAIRSNVQTGIPPIPKTCLDGSPNG